MTDQAGRLEVSMFDGTEGTIDLYRGVPGPETLSECHQMIKEATNLRLAIEDDNENLLFQYGPEDGDPLFLTELAKFLTAEYGAPVDRDSLVTTAGATNGLLHLLCLLFPNKCNVFVEEFSYFLGIDAMENDLNYTLISVPLEKDGIDVIAFEEMIVECKKKNKFDIPQHGFWSVLYIIPQFQNPTGRTLSLEKSKTLVRVAQKYRILIISEDVYNLLWYDNAASKMPRLFALDDRETSNGCVISNGSFTKYAAPGLRLGWIEMPQWTMKIWMSSSLLVSGGCLNMYTSGIMACALQSGLLSTQLQRLRERYQKRMKVFCDTLYEHLPTGCTFHRPLGGYFVWIEMPEQCCSKELNALAMQRHKIRFQEGWKFLPRSALKTSDNGFRVSISYYDENVLRTSAIQLCSLIKEHIIKNVSL